MAIDPRLILGIKSAQIQESDPMGSYGKALTLKNAMVQGDLQGLQAQAAKRGFDDEEAVRGAYRESGGDVTRLRTILGERGQHKTLQALDKFELEKREKESGIKKNDAQAGKARFDVDLQKLQHGAALLNEARDQQSWETVLRVGQVTGTFDPDFIAKLPKEYNPQVVTALRNAGVTRAQQLTDERAREQQAETGRHNLATEGTARGQLGVAQGNLRVSQDRLTHDKTTGRLPQGFRLNAQGSQEFIPGGPADPAVIARAEAAKAGGENQAKAAGSLPQIEASATRVDRLIDEMVGTAGRELKPGEQPKTAHPGFQSAVGASISKAVSPFWAPPGSNRADFQARLEEVQGGAFLEAFQALKGAGAITEKEGEKATTAINRMKSSQSEGEFVRAARDFQDVVRSGLKAAQQKAGGTQAAPGGRVGGVLTPNADGSFNYGTTR